MIVNNQTEKKRADKSREKECYLFDRLYQMIDRTMILLAIAGFAGWTFSSFSFCTPQNIFSVALLIFCLVACAQRNRQIVDGT